MKTYGFVKINSGFAPSILRLSYVNYFQNNDISHVFSETKFQSWQKTNPIFFVSLLKLNFDTVRKLDLLIFTFHQSQYNGNNEFFPFYPFP